jgi:gamma-glutamyl phosphate reductase
MTSSPPPQIVVLAGATSSQVNAVDEATRKLETARDEVLNALTQDPSLAQTHDMQDLLLQFKVTLTAAQTLRRKMAQVPKLTSTSPVQEVPSMPHDGDQPRKIP